MAFKTVTMLCKIGEQYNQWEDESEMVVQHWRQIAEDGGGQQQLQQMIATTTTTSSSSNNNSYRCNNSCENCSNSAVRHSVHQCCCPCRADHQRHHRNSRHSRQLRQQTPSTRMTGATMASSSVAVRRCALVLFMLCAQLSNSMVAGLTCYETVNGKTTIVQNESWTYCALVPATIVGNELVNGSQFGLGPDNDMMATYNTAFAMSADEYRILTVCIYERYDFSRFLTIKPDLAVEFAFRCVCNYDLCNSEPTFSAYLSAIKSESFARR